MILVIARELFSPAVNLLGQDHVIHYYSDTEVFEVAIVASLVNSTVEVDFNLLEEYKADHDFDALLYLISKQTTELFEVVTTMGLLKGNRVCKVYCKGFTDHVVVIEIEQELDF